VRLASTGGRGLCAIEGIRLLLRLSPKLMLPLLPQGALLSRDASCRGFGPNGDRHFCGFGQHPNGLLEAHSVPLGRKILVASEPTRNEVGKPEDRGER
jgi:hypothetical protein